MYVLPSCDRFSFEALPSWELPTKTCRCHGKIPVAILIGGSQAAGAEISILTHGSESADESSLRIFVFGACTRHLFCILPSCIFQVQQNVLVN